MTNFKKAFMYEDAFDIMEDVLLKAFQKSERKMRHEIKTILGDMLSHTIDDRKRNSIAEAYRRIQELSYKDIKTIVDILGPDGTNNGAEVVTDDYFADPDFPYFYFDVQTRLKNKILDSDVLDRMAIISDEGFKEVFELIARFYYDNKQYVELHPLLRVVLTLGKDQPTRFYQYIPAKESSHDNEDEELSDEADKLILVTDPDLLKILRVESDKAQLIYVEKEDEEAEKQALESTKQFESILEDIKKKKTKK